MSDEEREDALKFQLSGFYLEGTRQEDLNAPSSGQITPVVGRILRLVAVTSRKSSNLQPTPVVAVYRHLKPYPRICTKCLPSAAPAARIARNPTVDSSLAAITRILGIHRARSRLNLPAHYFPNALYCPYTYSSHELLADRPLWEVAKSLHEVIRSVKPQQMEKTNRRVAA